MMLHKTSRNLNSFHKRKNSVTVAFKKYLALISSLIPFHFYVIFIAFEPYLRTKELDSKNKLPLRMEVQFHMYKVPKNGVLHNKGKKNKHIFNN